MVVFPASMFMCRFFWLCNTYDLGCIAHVRGVFVIGGASHRLSTTDRLRFTRYVVRVISADVCVRSIALIKFPALFCAFVYINIATTH